MQKSKLISANLNFHLGLMLGYLKEGRKESLHIDYLLCAKTCPGHFETFNSPKSHQGGY